MYIHHNPRDQVHYDSVFSMSGNVMEDDCSRDDFQLPLMVVAGKDMHASYTISRAKNTSNFIREPIVVPPSRDESKGFL